MEQEQVLDEKRDSLPQTPFEPPKKSQLDFAFKFIKQSIIAALEETETALASLSFLENEENIPADISEQDIMIMEETAQVGYRHLAGITTLTLRFKSYIMHHLELLPY